MKSLTLAFLIAISSGCTLHVCGNSDIAHQVGDGGVIEEEQKQTDSAKADVKVPVKPM